MPICQARKGQNIFEGNRNMAKRKVVVALGGNAILSSDPSAQAQQEALIKTVEYLVQFVEQGDDLIVTHGNGPQVGNLLLQQLADQSTKNPAMPLDTCVAMTEGSIGYWLQNAFQNVLAQRKLKRQVATVVTQVIVSPTDPAFKHPSKPIGPFLSEDEAKKEMKTTNATFVEDAGRGWRKVVPSPKPIAIQEHQVIASLVDQGVITIACGGGGVPVVDEDGLLKGVEAVIDKDFASQKLAELIEADLFIILTGVDNVYVHYNQPDQKRLEKVSIEELKDYIAAEEFAAGSMLPKVKAAIGFVENCPQNKAIITSLENIDNLLKNDAGTIVTK